MRLFQILNTKDYSLIRVKSADTSKMLQMLWKCTGANIAIIPKELTMFYIVIISTKMLMKMIFVRTDNLKGAIHSVQEL
jgi:hypothetical protein